MTSPITSAGFDRLQAELHRLTNDVRPALVADLNIEARAAGFADHSAASRAVIAVDEQINRIAARIADTQVIVPQPPSDPFLIRFGATVAIKADDGILTTLHLVGPDEADAARGRISIASPLGRALVGSRRGDEITVAAPSGACEYTIADVSYS